MDNELICYTIGHSRHDIDYFVRLLNAHQIGRVVDVRSNPYSIWVSQFNKEQLLDDLAFSGVEYIYMGDRLGGRYTNTSLFMNGTKIVDYEKVSRTLTFQNGLGRMMELLKKPRGTAIMCSEEDPFRCHRFGLIAHHLTKKGVRVKHILEGGGLAPNEQLEMQMLEKYRIKYNQQALLDAKMMEEFIEEGYVRHNKHIAR